jgi:hypothetical protein
MSPRLRLFSALGAALLLGVACASVSNSGLDTQTALNQIRSTYKSLDEAVARKDAGAIGGFLADDLKVTMADGSTAGKEQFAQALASRPGATRIDKFDFEPGKVVAVVTPGAGSASARETWRRSNGGWKLHEVEALATTPAASVATR